MRSLLIPLTYFCLQTWLGTAQVKCLVVLNMMPNAFDDQYIGCADKMDNDASELLEKEKSWNNRLKNVWDHSKTKWASVKPKLSLPTNFKDEYGRAIVAYTNSTPLDNVVFSTEFNQAVRGNGTSQAHYMAKFHFKAFHYYLTRALQLLRGKCDQMVYRGVPDEYKHTEGFIRFGQFASSSLDEQEAKKFAEKGPSGASTVFTIHTCFGVDISEFSYNPNQKEVLIPIHEIFTEDKDNIFVLRSTKQTCNHFNCAYLGGEKNKTCVNNTATRGGVAFPGGMSPSLFGGSVILIHAAALKLTAGF
ncbi:ecto-ADP-ribosyltransferase 5-like [Pelodiscus sinensis]|uniref:ecto-ADP-ribosyltransferase 5-like n=1 Tax=Pelodiscus sinensis TaxID=13735 RepID=UPI003F6AB574